VRPGPLPEVAVPAPRAALVSRLRAAGCVFAEDEADALLAAARSDGALEVLVARRVSGEPLELVLGWVWFAGLRIAVEPGVFVPRRRTELVVEVAAGLVPPRAGRPVVVDLCCGTGAVGTALAAALGPRRVELHAADVDPAAVRCARRNLGPLGGQVHEGDLFAALPARLRGRVDLLAVNAPYVPTDAIALMPPEARDHEPRPALDGGPDGLAVHRRVAAGAARWLAPGGALVLETSRSQAPDTAAAVAAGGLRARVVRSDERDATVVVGTPAAARRPVK
jgi:release factor glutamine methyltransferase